VLKVKTFKAIKKSVRGQQNTFNLKRMVRTLPKYGRKAKYYARIRTGTRTAAGASAMVMAVPRRRLPWRGGFAINRMGPTWTIGNINTGAPGEFQALSDVSNLPTVGASTFSIGTAVQVNGFSTHGQFNVPFSLNFALNAVTAYTDITQISDRYKIDKVKVTFWCAQTQAVGQDPNSSLSPTNISAMPTLRWIQDTDDTVVGTVQQYKEVMNLRVGNMTNGRRIDCWIRPKPAPVLYQPEGGSAYAVPSTPMFINSAYPGVVHYGIKGFFENVQGAQVTTGGQVYNPGVTIMCETVYYVSVRDLQ